MEAREGQGVEAAEVASNSKASVSSDEKTGGAFPPHKK